MAFRELPGYKSSAPLENCKRSIALWALIFIKEQFVARYPGFIVNKKAAESSDFI